MVFKRESHIRLTFTRLKMRKNPVIRALLIPFSILYGTVNYVRNKAFDYNILESKKFHTPTICVGNITVGGTGKTPHIEYLISKLINVGTLATLSRGYKRKSKGFQLASHPASSITVGDEPAQLKNKFPETIVAVDSDRRNGITKIQQQHPEVDIILLDDAYQHRYVKAKLNILLIDYNRPIFNDFMLPAGDLREVPSGIKRADIIIITKCPADIDTIKTRNYYLGKPSVKTNHFFFSHYRYKNLISVKSGQEKQPNILIKTTTQCTIITGIASPKHLTQHIANFSSNLTLLNYPDHHNFTENDIHHIKRQILASDTDDKIIITTEKDYSRLKEMNLPKTITDILYYLPIEVEILDNKETELLKIIKSYVTKDI